MVVGPAVSGEPGLVEVGAGEAFGLTALGHATAFTVLVVRTQGLGRTERLLYATSRDVQCRGGNDILLAEANGLE